MTVFSRFDVYLFTGSLRTFPDIRVLSLHILYQKLVLDTLENVLSKLFLSYLHLTVSNLCYD